ncbi:hypothetical protein LEP1GSC065_1909 [Leptospira kirschneri serovar Sokoine str. RM1]|uniref:hypothetical protein n=1 Tax=Leptospira kirschneri TaxID=29507 RepID=UPI0002BD6BA0|nr:hypothetical protein [Leptospira kirschneri]EMN24233.1 hypothetical protein LEP1GSC065_1909 [Leptospira kirschneri serovar Sokoine str. RM1]
MTVDAINQMEKDCRSSSYADVLKFQRLGLNLSKGSHKNVLFNKSKCFSKYLYELNHSVSK